MKRNTTTPARARAGALPLLAAAALAATALGACRPAEGADAPRSRTTYGAPVSLGRGTLRSYVTTKDGVPTELGVALSELALAGLPATGVGHHGGGGPVHQFLLDFPTASAAPFRFVEVNWNPMGHEPEGVYQDVPHFDFHFYTVSREARDSIVRSDPRWATRANALPAADFLPPYALQLGPPGAAPADVAVPKMGVHWVDTRSPELQRLLGKPEAYAPFTRTFLHGSWNGRVHFFEPMITRAHLLAKKAATDPTVRDERIALPIPARYAEPGRYPTAYRITWDAGARE